MDMSSAPMCLDASEQLFLGVFDLSLAPELLYYAYIPILLVSVFVGAYIYRQRSNTSNANRWFFVLTVLFAIYILNELAQWVLVPAPLVHFAWELIALIKVLLVICVIYFVRWFLYEKPMSLRGTVTVGLLFIPVLLLLPTKMNMTSFDLAWCEADIGPLFYYVYLVEAVAVLSITYFGIQQYTQARSNRDRQIILLTVGGAISFISFLLFTDLIGEITGDFEYLLIGPIGMAIFLSLIGYLTIKYHVFNIRLISSQILVFAVFTLIGSQVFFIQTKTNLILTLITLALTSVLGVYLVKGVKQEIRQREEIEGLAEKLASANRRLRKFDKLKSEFVSIASHQLRSPLTAIRGYASMILSGSYGPLTAKLRAPIEHIEESAHMMTNSIEDYLSVSRIESGNMKYDYTDLNIKDMASDIVDGLRAEALKSGLVLQFKSNLDGLGIVHADKGKVQQILHNLINNALKYTPKGRITVFVHDDISAQRIHVEIIDTGIGMSSETQAAIFAKFERAEGASSVNVHGTGLGLYVALKMAQAMGGDITAHSDGEGLGSHFILSLPLQH